MDSTIAARNAQMRKARQHGPSLDREVDVSTLGLTRDNHPPAVPEDAVTDSFDDNAGKRRDPFATIVETSQPLLAHDKLRSVVTTEASFKSPEVIVVSSDSDEIEASSTKSMYGSTDTRLGDTWFESATCEYEKTEGERALQQLFDRNRDFYESLDREMAHREARTCRSEASSSSVRMESMVPDASTSYETSSWAPTRSVYSHEVYSAATPLNHAPSDSMNARQANYEPHRADMSAPAPFMYDAEGHLFQYPPVQIGPTSHHPVHYYPNHESVPAAMESSQAWTQTPSGPYAPAFELAHLPSRNDYLHRSHEPGHHAQYQHNWSHHPSTSSAANDERAKLATFRRPVSPRRAQEDRAKADCESIAKPRLHRKVGTSLNLNISTSHLQWCIKRYEERASVHGQRPAVSQLLPCATKRGYLADHGSFRTSHQVNRSLHQRARSLNGPRSKHLE